MVSVVHLRVFINTLKLFFVLSRNRIHDPQQPGSLEQHPLVNILFLQPHASFFFYIIVNNLF